MACGAGAAGKVVHGFSRHRARTFSPAKAVDYFSRPRTVRPVYWEIGVRRHILTDDWAATIRQTVTDEALVCRLNGGVEGLLYRGGRLGGAGGEIGHWLGLAPFYVSLRMEFTAAERCSVVSFGVRALKALGDALAAARAEATQAASQEAEQTQGHGRRLGNHCHAEVIDLPIRPQAERSQGNCRRCLLSRVHERIKLERKWRSRS